MLDHLLEIALSALLASAAATLPIVVPAARRWLIERAGLSNVLKEGELARRLDEGATNILMSAIKSLRKRPGDSEPTEREIIDHAAPKVERNFPETLKTLRLNREAVRDFLRARVGRANGQLEINHR